MLHSVHNTAGRDRSSMAFCHGLLTPFLLATALALSGQTANPTAAETIAGLKAAMQAGDASAIALAEAAATRFPDEAAILLWLGHAYRHGRQLTAASAAYLRAATLDPDHPEILMGQASLREVVGDLLGAMALYERVVDVAPEFAAGWRAAGVIQMQLGDHGRAVNYFAQYLELAPGDPDVRYLYGVALYFGGSHDEAIATLEESVERYPDLVSVRYALGVVLADRPESHGRALALLQVAAEAGFEEVEATYLIGRIHADQGELEPAVAAFERTIDLDGDHLDAHYRLASALARLGRREDAKPIMTRFSELQQRFNADEAHHKQLKTARNELAAAIAARDGAAVERAVQEMLSLAPEDPDVLVAVAKVWISTGRESAAFDACAAASQIAPEHWEANYLYGLLLTSRGRPQDALEPLRRSLAGNPLFVLTHVVTGNSLMLLGEPDAAADSYLAAIDLEADNPGYWLNLATAYGELGRTDLQRRAGAEYQRLMNEQTPTREQ